MFTIDTKMWSKEGDILLMITTKLKRIKTMRICAEVLLFVPRLPLLLFYSLGRGAEWIHGLLESLYHNFESKIVKIFKLDDVAREQYKKNPDKFKR